MVAPIGNRFIKKSGQLIIIIILIYIFYRNFTETRNLSATIKGDKNSDATIDMKNNVLISYGLCAFIAILLLYITYLLFD
jgi:hypothetical protein